MPRWKTSLLSMLAMGAAWAAPPASAPVPKTPPAKPAAVAADNDVRLYALDCGHLDFKSLGMFSDTGDYDGKPGRIETPCYLIRHAQGWMLWQAGIGDGYAQSPQGVDALDGLVHVQAQNTLAGQLKQLDLKPADINGLAYSSLRESHVGNANLVGKTARWIANASELAWARSEPAPLLVDPGLFARIDSADVHTIAGDQDVFGDGKVVILRAPGPTPGHQVLLLRLKKAGAVLLAGDLFPLRGNRASRLVPALNASRADTLASIDRIERIAANQKARVIAEGDPADFAALPKFPAWLD